MSTAAAASTSSVKRHRKPGVPSSTVMRYLRRRTVRSRIL
jgi:hypothetical protein